MDEKNRITVNIQGQDYKLVSDDSKVFMHQVASYVDDRLSEIASSNIKLSPSTVAVLTALNIADEYHKLMAKVGAGEFVAKDKPDMQSTKDQIIELSAELEKRGSEYEAMTSQFEQLLDNSTMYESELDNLKKKLHILSYEIEYKDKELRDKDAELKVLEKEILDLKSRTIDE